MTQTITVYFNGSGLLVNANVAQRLGLINGQNILSEKHFWEILGANCSHGLSISQHLIEQEAKKN